MAIGAMMETADHSRGRPRLARDQGDPTAGSMGTSPAMELIAMRQSLRTSDPFEERLHWAIRCSIFRGIPPDLLDGLLADAIRVELPAGRFLPDAGLSLVVEGLVRISAVGPDGRQVTAAYLKVGDVMGLARAAGQEYPVTYQTMSDCRLLRIAPERFEGLRSQHPCLGWAAAGQLARHLDDLVDGIVLSALGSVRQRVIYHLLALSAPSSGTSRRTYRVTRQQLADSVGSVREVVTRVLSELRRERLITEDHRLFIPDPARLRGEVHDLVGRDGDTQVELRSRSA